MSFSEDEEEEVLKSVTNYYFTDQADEPISFSVLPIKFDDGESFSTSAEEQVYLHGSADSGPQKIYKQVIAWMLEFKDHPEISVLLKDERWIKLQRPRKSYEETMRTISVTITSLEFLKRNEEASEKVLTDHLQKHLSSYDPSPSIYEILEHEPLIRKMMEKDQTLGVCKFLVSFLEGTSRCTLDESIPVSIDQDYKRKNFIADDDIDDDLGEEDGEELDLFDSVCAICDNGGEILSCEGRCLRSFHPTRDAGAESDCKSLGFTKSQVEEMKRFYCPNCAHDMHQCFACGKLGSSKKAEKPEIKLRVYLAPFLHGMTYSSYGRHFTEKNKLKDIVDKLHWYMESGDMLVDFCCGSNDFSTIMAEKLKETVKTCYFKNFDIIQPKNDFCFTKKDWMTVTRDELLTGSKLIMGLNPPFGVKAALANKFIDKALEFRPKLIILICPPETERLNKKREPYDLIWEDDQKLAGKSFYLPGSVDVHDKQIEQWNIVPPLLYLWSRSDWTSKHLNIARQRGHISHDTEVDVVEQQRSARGTFDIPRQVDDFVEVQRKQVQDELQKDKMGLKKNREEHKDYMQSFGAREDDNGRGKKGSTATPKDKSQDSKHEHEQSSRVSEQRPLKRSRADYDDTKEREANRSQDDFSARGLGTYKSSFDDDFGTSLGARRSSFEGDNYARSKGTSDNAGRKFNPHDNDGDGLSSRHGQSRDDHLSDSWDDSIDASLRQEERRWAGDIAHALPSYVTGKSALNGHVSDNYEQTTFAESLDVRLRQEEELHRHQLLGRSGSILGRPPDYGGNGPLSSRYGRSDAEDLSRVGSSTMQRYALHLNDYASSSPSNHNGGEAVPPFVGSSMFRSSSLDRMGYPSESLNYPPGRFMR